MPRKRRKPGPWERENKTISFRVPPELAERIDALRKQMPLRDIVLKSLGLVELEARASAAGQEDGRFEGFEVGFEEGFRRVEAWCDRCGQRVQYDTRRPGVQEVLDRALRTSGVMHIGNHVGPEAGPPRKRAEDDEQVSSSYEETIRKHPEYACNP
jgi:hypothetical protein